MVASPSKIKEYYSYDQSYILDLWYCRRWLLIHLWREPVGETHLSAVLVPRDSAEIIRNQTTPGAYIRADYEAIPNFLALRKGKKKSTQEK